MIVGIGPVFDRPGGRQGKDDVLVAANPGFRAEPAGLGVIGFQGFFDRLDQKFPGRPGLPAFLGRARRWKKRDHPSENQDKDGKIRGTKMLICHNSS
jgi:hypothetical protein